MIVIVDYGMGNLHSILSKIGRLKYGAIVSSCIDDIEAASKIIFPGVGQFASGMANIRARGLVDVLNKKVLKERTPILGICLGMQLMTSFSEEGNVDGLGWVEARTRLFDFSGNKTDAASLVRLRIPHVGWNKVNFQKDSLLFRGVVSGSRFYFSHSYHICCERIKDVTAVTDHGYDFVSAIEKENIFGVQFHPEKSHSHGISVIENFLRYA